MKPTYWARSVPFTVFTVVGPCTPTYETYRRLFQAEGDHEGEIALVMVVLFLTMAELPQPKPKPVARTKTRWSGSLTTKLR